MVTKKVWQFQPASSNPVFWILAIVWWEELHKKYEWLFLLTINKETLYKRTDLFLFLPTFLSPQKALISSTTTTCTPHSHSLKLLLGASLSLPHFIFLGEKTPKNQPEDSADRSFLTWKKIFFLRQSLAGSLKTFHCRVLSALQNLERKMSWHWMAYQPCIVSSRGIS